MIGMDLTGITNGQRAMVEACPMVCIPPLTTHVPLQEPGRRWVMGADGLYLEARSLAVHAMILVSAADSAYGSAKQFARTINGKVPQELLDRCMELAVEAGDKETAALIHWNPAEKKYELSIPDIISAGAAHVTYRDESLDELLVIDFHSHGHLPGYFSTTDDESDRSRIGPYIATVAGSCQSMESLKLCTRICLSPYLINLNELNKDRLQ